MVWLGCSGYAEDSSKSIARLPRGNREGEGSVLFCDYLTTKRKVEGGGKSTRLEC